MALLSFKQIKDASDVKIVKVPVPEWGAEAFVCIRNLKAWQRDKFDFEATKGDNIHLRARLVAMSLCDEDGNFYDCSDEDVIDLSEKNGAVVDRLSDECCKLSRIGALGKAAYEELEKNSHGQNGSSGAS